MHNFIKNLVLLLAILIAASCNPQKKIAKKFVNESVNYKLMVLEPSFIYKNNLNTQIVDSLNITDEEERAKMLWEQSDFFSLINDSLFIANYILGYKTELSNYGIEVFDEKSAENFLAEDSNAYLVNIAQIEIEEEDYEYRDEAEYNSYVYFHDHILKAVNVNTWFEISKVNASNNSENIFYATNTITDDLTSSFEYNIFNEKVEYIYEVDSLSMPKIYEYVYLLGRIYATYTYDFMLNKYIEESLNYGMKKEDLLRYNPNTKTFFYAGENRFVMMDE